MKAWDVTAARLWMTAPSAALLCDWSVVPESLVMYSGPCEVAAELVPWDGEDDVDLAGKIPFTRHRINDVFPQMRRQGMRGIVSDFLGTLPGVRDPFDLPDAVRWENSALRPGAGQYWGFINDTISSDPNLDVPLPCLIQYPSRNYHSSADRLDTLSAQVMERIGVLSAPAGDE